MFNSLPLSFPFLLHLDRLWIRIWWRKSFRIYEKFSLNNYVMFGRWLNKHDESIFFLFETKSHQSSEVKLKNWLDGGAQHLTIESRRFVRTFGNKKPKNEFNISSFNAPTPTTINVHTLQVHSATLEANSKTVKNLRSFAVEVKNISEENTHDWTEKKSEKTF